MNYSLLSNKLSSEFVKFGFVRIEKLLGFRIRVQNLNKKIRYCKIFKLKIKWKIGEFSFNDYNSNFEF